LPVRRRGAAANLAGIGMERIFTAEHAEIAEKFNSGKKK
jgi:hypothetical protein